MSELDGFVVYRPSEMPVYIAAHDKYIGVSAGAYAEIGMPDCVNVFLDECGKRIMIKVAEESYENVMKVIAHTAGRNHVICNKKLTVKVREMYGRNTHIKGHLVSDGCMIFDKVERGKHEGKTRTDEAGK